MIKLTPRQKQVIIWAARGKSGTVTGIILGMSEHTVNFHRKCAMARLGVAGINSAVAMAIFEGIISREDVFGKAP